jgi:hypothetical protein
MEKIIKEENKCYNWGSYKDVDFGNNMLDCTFNNIKVMFGIVEAELSEKLKKEYKKYKEENKSIKDGFFLNVIKNGKPCKLKLANDGAKQYRLYAVKSDGQQIRTKYQPDINEGFPDIRFLAVKNGFVVNEKNEKQIKIFMYNKDKNFNKDGGNILFIDYIDVDMKDAKRYVENAVEYFKKRENVNLEEIKNNIALNIEKEKVLINEEGSVKNSEKYMSKEEKNAVKELYCIRHDNDKIINKNVNRKKILSEKKIKKKAVKR